jgi:hypothetical protein
MSNRQMMKAAAGLMLAAMSSAGISAGTGVDGSPTGIQGRDWDSQSFRIVDGHIAEVTATNVTTDTVNGNRSGVQIFIDGALIDKDETDSAMITKSHLVRGNGSHRVMVICSNFHATANICSVRVAAVAEDPVI